MKNRIIALLMSLVVAVSAAAVPAEAATTTNADGSTTVSTESKKGDIRTTKETTTTASGAKFITITTKNVMSGETTIDVTSYDSNGKELSQSVYKVAGVQGDTVKLTSLSTTESAAVVSDTITSCGTEYRVYKIGAMVLTNNDAIKSLTIGKNVIAIGDSAFSGNKNLKKITINTSQIDYVGENAFDGIAKKATISIKAKKSLYKHTVKWIKLSGIDSSVKFKRI